MMSSSGKNSKSFMDEIFTIADVAKRAKISHTAAFMRLKAHERAGELCPFVKRGNTYLLTPEQAQSLCMGFGRGRDAINFHAKKREKPTESAPRRRKAS